MLKKIEITSLLMIIIICILFIPVYAVENSELQKNQNIDSVDYEIAKILFKGYFDNEFNENSVSKASYDSDGKKFSCEYIIKTYEESYKTDNIEIYTYDFLTYRFATMKYEFDEEKNKYVPHSYNGDYTEITNKDKNSIINLANSAGYYTGKNLSDEDFLEMLEIVFLNDTKKLKQVINENNYILKNYYISEDYIHFLYLQEDNKANYIDVHSAYKDVNIWCVYGENDKKIFEDSTLLYDSYIVDYNIVINQKQTEINTIYNKLERK